METPWLDIPLLEYEAHMALASVGQAVALAEEFENLLRRFKPRSVAVLGCSGGNGFERISPRQTTRVVGVDINPRYLNAALERYQQVLPGLELVVCDVQMEAVPFEPVELVYAGLLLEYVTLAPTLRFIRGALSKNGVLGCVLQRQSASVPVVSPSPYTSLRALAPAMNLVDPTVLEALAASHNLHLESSRTVHLPNGKSLLAQVYLSH